MDELVASRRRVWFGMIMVAAFGLLMIAALLPAPSKSLRVEQAAADETIPDTSVIVATDVAAVTPTTAAPTTTGTVPVERPTTTTTDAPVTTTTTTPPKKAVAVVKAPLAISAPAPTIGVSDAAFLACIRMRESHNTYTTVSSSGNYRGAYQFNQPAWDATAQHAGRPDLIGAHADQVSPADQDALALDLYHWKGSAPWGGACD